jgi:small subunit ribosomal protein S6
MPLYEHVFLARQDLAQAQVDGLAETATKIIEDNGGDAPAPLVAELERQTQINEDVIRYMTLRVDAHEEGPSAMMRRGDRDRERGRGRDREDGGRGRGRDDYDSE